MARFAAANPLSDDNAVLKQALTRLIQLLDTGYVVESTLNGITYRISITAKEGIVITADATEIMWIDTATGNIRFAGDITGSSGTFSGQIAGGSISIPATNPNFYVSSAGQTEIKNSIEINNGIVVNCGKNPSYTVSTTIDNINCQDFGTRSGLGLWVNGISFFDQSALFDAYINVSNGIHVGGTSESETPFLMLHSSSGGSGGYVQADGGVYADDNIESNNDMWADAFNLNSDARLKENVAPIQSGVDLILNLNPVQYTMINCDSGRTHYGFIAQEFKQAMTDVGIEDCATYVDRSYETPDDPARYKDTLGLRYMELIAPMVQTIQSLEQRIKDLEARLAPSV